MSSTSADYVDAALNAMVLIMMADGHGHESEATAVTNQYKKLTGNDLDRGKLDVLCSKLGDNYKSGWGVVVAANLEEDEKHRILNSCVHVCMADGELQDEEFALLGRIARAYGVHRSTMRQIMSDVWGDRES